MSPKTTLFLIVVCAAILFFYMQDKEKVAEEQKIEEQKKQFVVAESADIMDLSIERGGKTIKAVRDKDSWTLKEPIEWPAEKFAWQTIADNLASAEIERRFPAEGEELTETDLVNWQLQPEHLKLTATLREASKEVTFRFGTNPPGSSSSVFALSSDASGEAFIIPKSVVFSASKTLFDLRERKMMLVRFDHDDLKQLEVRNKDLSFTAKLDANGQWVLPEEGGIRADVAAIRPFLQKLNEEAKAILDDVPAEVVREYGLAADQLDSATQVKAVYGSDSKVSTFTIGKLDPKQQGYVAKRDGIESLFVVKQDALIGTSSNLEALRPKKAIPLETYNTEIIEATKFGETLYRLKKLEFNWRMGIPHDATAERDKVDGLVRAFNDHKITSFVTDATSDAQLGLEPPMLVFHVAGKDNKSETVLFGSRNGLGQVYAAWKGYPDRFLIDQEILDILMPESLLDLLTPMEKERVAPKAEEKVMDLTEPAEAGEVSATTESAPIEPPSVQVVPAEIGSATPGITGASSAASN